jgi:hypothetical protein
VALVRTDILEEHIASIIKVTRIGEIRIKLTVTSNPITLPILVTLMMEAICSSEMAVLTRTTRRRIPDDSVLLSHRRETLKHIELTGWDL